MFSYGSPSVSTMVSYCFPMVFLWFSQGFLIVFPTAFFIQLFLWLFLQFSLVFPIVFHIASLLFPFVFHMVSLLFSFCLPLVSLWLSYSYINSFHHPFLVFGLPGAFFLPTHPKIDRIFHLCKPCLQTWILAQRNKRSFWRASGEPLDSLWRAFGEPLASLWRASGERL